ncbi:MAG: hypothetical protein PHG64_09770 [Paludibacter sp.]|nr:hypothetical protein [Paludibacter sp.]
MSGGAITLEEREAVPYDEIATIERMIPKGEKTIIAHLKHLKEHGEFGYLKEAVGYLKANKILIDFSVVHNMSVPQHQGGGCPGSKEISFTAPKQVTTGFKMLHTDEPASQLRQWPVQLHLLNSRITSL